MSEQSSVLENLYQEELYLVRNKVLVVINKAWVDLREEEITLLSKILGSVKQSLSGVQIISRYSLSAEQIRAFPASKILLFGCETQPAIKPYELNRISEISLIYADDLEKLDDGRKKSLWTALKQMFAA